MKNLLVTICILGVVGLFTGVSVWGGASSTISCTVTAKNISLSVSDGSIAYGTLAVNSSTTSATLGDTQVVTNDGNVTEDINVMSSDATGGTQWNLASTTGSDEYLHRFSNDAEANWTICATDHSYSQLKNALGANGTTSLDLCIDTPTASTDYQQKTINVTVQAVED